MSINISPEAGINTEEAIATQELINKKIEAWKNGYFAEANELAVIFSDKNFYDRFSLSWDNEEGETVSLEGLTLVVHTAYSKVDFVNQKNEILSTVRVRELPEILVSEKV